MGKGNILTTKCFHMLFLALFFQSLTFHLFYHKIFLEATNLNSISFFSRPQLLSFVPATVILWAVKNSFTWHAATERGMCDSSVFRKKEWKKNWREKNPILSNVETLPRKLHPQVVSPPALEKANPLKQSFGSTDRKAQPLTLPSPRCLEGKQTSLWPYLSLHITGKQH